MADYSITGNNSLTGSAEDDLFSYMAPPYFSSISGDISGGDGTDTLRISTSNGADPSVNLTLLNLTGTLSSIERIDLASNENATLSLTMKIENSLPGTTMIGGDGKDHVQFMISNAGIYTTPDLKFENWQSADSVSLTSYSRSSPLSVILNARDNYGAKQILAGGAGHDILNGSNGDDTLVLTAGGDHLFGNAGNDRFSVSGTVYGTPQTETQPQTFDGLLEGGDGIDTLNVRGSVILRDVTLHNIEKLALSPLEVTVLPANSAPYTLTSPAQLITDTSVSGERPDLEIGGTGTLTLNLAGQRFNGSDIAIEEGTAIAFTINGSTKADNIVGTSGAETIVGNGGADVIFGAAGDDHLLGGVGNDYLQGDAGDDWLDGGLGDDVLVGGAGRDVADYSALSIPSAAPGTSALGVTVDLGITVRQDTHLGGQDKLSGVEGLLGTSYTDLLIGNEQANNLFGNMGDDRLIGGGGADALFGNSGADVFAYRALSDSAPGATTRDTIWDFTHSEGDRIDLSSVDANSRLAGDQAFYLGGSSFTRHAGEIIQIQQGGDTVIRADVNGDAIADFALLLHGITSPLVTDDFLL